MIVASLNLFVIGHGNLRLFMHIFERQQVI